MSIENLKLSENEISLAYTKVAQDALSKKDTVIDEFRWVLRELDLPISDVYDFLESFLSSKFIDEDSITAIGYNKGVFHIEAHQWDYSFQVKEIENFRINKILNGHNKELTERRAKNIELAIKSIFDANDKVIFDGEINNKDVLKDNDFWEEVWLNLKWKNLSELREMLDIENRKLLELYNITGESEKRQALIREELLIFAGVWWIYEWWAKYFSLSREEIDHKVENLLASMWDINEVFKYIKSVNADIKNNFKKSDMVNQVNGKLIQSLYTQTFKRLKSSNAPNQDFIAFAKILTGRWEILRWKNGDYKYGKLKMERKWKDYQMANEAIIYAMLRDDGVMDNLTQKITVEDPEVNTEDSTESILTNAVSVLESFSKKIWKTWADLAADLGYEDITWIKWSYNELDFNEKIRLWWLVRIADILQNITPTQLEKDPGLIEKKIVAANEDAFKDINEDVSDNFDGDGFSWWLNGWKNAKELWLSWDLAEVFSLYQDMNGNEWIFDLSDKTKDMLTPTLRWALALWASIAIACVILATLPASASVWAIMLAWAAAWAATWAITSALWDQWYDTYKEAIIDTSAIIATDAVVWSLFFLWSIKFFKWAFNKNILDTRFLSWWTLGDAVAFGGTETVVNSMITTPIVSSEVKQSHPENHFDTDKD